MSWTLSELSGHLLPPIYIYFFWRFFLASHNDSTSWGEQPTFPSRSRMPKDGWWALIALPQNFPISEVESQNPFIERTWLCIWFISSFFFERLLRFFCVITTFFSSSILQTDPCASTNMPAWPLQARIPLIHFLPSSLQNSALECSRPSNHHSHPMGHSYSVAHIARTALPPCSLCLEETTIHPCSICWKRWPCNSKMDLYSFRHWYEDIRRHAFVCNQHAYPNASTFPPVSSHVVFTQTLMVPSDRYLQHFPSATYIYALKSSPLGWHSSWGNGSGARSQVKSDRMKDQTTKYFSGIRTSFINVPGRPHLWKSSGVKVVFRRVSERSVHVVYRWVSGGMSVTFLCPHWALGLATPTLRTGLGAEVQKPWSWNSRKVKEGPVELT